jgi:hypothetical protein
MFGKEKKIVTPDFAPASPQTPGLPQQQQPVEIPPGFKLFKAEIKLNDGKVIRPIIPALDHLTAFTKLNAYLCDCPTLPQSVTLDCDGKEPSKLVRSNGQPQIGH